MLRDASQKVLNDVNVKVGSPPLILANTEAEKFSKGSQHHILNHIYLNQFFSLPFRSPKGKVYIFSLENVDYSGNVSPSTNQ